MTGRNAAEQDTQRTQTQLALGVMLVPLFFVAMFAACIIGTYHKPHPNNIKVGVVGPAAQTARLRADLQRSAGSAFDIREVAGVGDAIHDVRQRHLNAALVPNTNPKQPVTVIVASAGGRLVATAAETLARSFAAANGSRLAVDDVRPLTAGDEIGLGIFMFTIVLTICGYIAPTILDTVAPALVPSRRYAIITATAVLLSTIAYLVAGLGFATYKGSVWTILAFIGVGALYTAAIGLGTRLFQVLLGPAGIFLSLAILVFLNIASLGATYTGTMLPSFWRFLNHFWIGAGAVNAERSLLYYGGLGIGIDMLRLLAWTAAIVALLLLPVSQKLEYRRERSVVDATSATSPRQVAEQT